MRSELGTFNVLILNNIYPVPDKPIFEYNTDDINIYLNFNIKNKKAFI